MVYYEKCWQAERDKHRERERERLFNNANTERRWSHSHGAARTRDDAGHHLTGPFSLSPFNETHRRRGRRKETGARRGIVLEGRWAPGGQDQGHYLDGLIAMQKLTMANGMIGVCPSWTGSVRVQVAFCPLPRRPA